MRHFFHFLLTLPLFLGADVLEICLHDLSSIVYHFNGDVCEKIVRLSPSGEIRYEHTYHYDGDNRIVSESLIGGLGEVIYSGCNENGYLVPLLPLEKKHGLIKTSVPLRKQTSQKLTI